MYKCFCLLLFLLLFPVAQTFAQDKQNFTVAPQSTDCDSINFEQPADKLIQTIENTKFRFRQKFTINRKNGFQGAFFYSCDNQIGYLIIKEDNKKIIYNEIPITEWKNMLSGSNPINYYYQKIAPEYNILQ